MRNLLYTIALLSITLTSCGKDNMDNDIMCFKSERVYIEDTRVLQDFEDGTTIILAFASQNYEALNNTCGINEELVAIGRPPQLPTDMGMLGATWHILPTNPNYFIGLTGGGDYRIFTSDTTWVNGSGYAEVIFKTEFEVIDWLNNN